MIGTNNGRPLQIDVGRQTRQYVFELHPSAEARVVEEHTAVHSPRMVVIGYGHGQEREFPDETIYKQIATMLTGLTWEQILERGGVRFYLPGSDQILWECTPVVTSAR